MVSLRLESSDDVLDLADVENTGLGWQATAGVTGFGLPPVDVQWVSGAGNGARYRSSRVLPRDIDIPLYADGGDRSGLKVLASRLAKMFAEGECKLVFSESVNDEWYTMVARTGGGDWVYGQDTNGERELVTVVTVTAGDPFFTSTTDQKLVLNAATPVGLLTGGKSLSMLQLGSVQALGSVPLINNGDAKAYPVWNVYGPATSFSAVDESGNAFVWTGTLASSDVLTIDTKAGTALDQLGVNRYGGFSSRPQMWAIPANNTTATITLAGSTSASRVEVTWSARRWVNV